MIKEITTWSAQCAGCKAPFRTSYHSASELHDRLKESGWWVDDDGVITVCTECRAGAKRMAWYFLSKEYRAEFIPEVANILSCMTAAIEATIRDGAGLVNQDLPDEIPY